MPDVQSVSKDSASSELRYITEFSSNFRMILLLISSASEFFGHTITLLDSSFKDRYGILSPKIVLTILSWMIISGGIMTVPYGVRSIGGIAIAPTLGKH